MSAGRWRGHRQMVVGPHRERAVGTRHVGLPEIRGTASRRAAANKGPLRSTNERFRTWGRVRMLPSAAASAGIAQRRRSSWLDEASANRTFGVRRRASGAPATSTTRASSCARPRPCARRDHVQRGPVMSSVRTKFQVVALRCATSAPSEGGRGQHRGAPRRAGSSASSTGATILARERRPRHLASSPPRDAPSPTRPRPPSRRCSGPPGGNGHGRGRTRRCRRLSLHHRASGRA